jgi:hypothetical protein
MRKLLTAALIAIATQAAADDQVKWTGQALGNLTNEEIADAHTCRVETFLAVCAGNKTIATGIIVANSILGSELTGPVEDHWKFTDKSLNDFTMDAFVSLSQANPPWEKAYYILSGDQLSRVVEKARREPNWNPRAGLEKQRNKNPDQ